MYLVEDECEDVVHVLWECPAYKDSFVAQDQNERDFKDFEALKNIERPSLVLGR